MDNFLIP